jgi:hypothetical protein
MQNTGRPLPLLHTIAALLVGAALILAPMLGTVFAPAPAQAAPVCSTDLDCAAWELQQAVAAGTPIYEDLSFAGASVLYGAKNELLADAFWAAHAGEDWQDVKAHVEAWVAAYRQA